MPPKIYFWTPEKDAILRERYDSRPGVPLSIARSFGWPAWAIKRRAAVLGLCRPPTTPPRPWTAAEVAYLEEHAGTRVVASMARRLGRPISATVLKLRRLGLSRLIREDYTLRSLAECFGVDHHAVDRWIRLGLLVGDFRHGGAAPAYDRDARRFTDANVLAFVKANPTAFELRRVDQTWFLDLMLDATGPGHQSRPTGLLNWTNLMARWKVERSHIRSFIRAGLLPSPLKGWTLETVEEFERRRAEDPQLVAFESRRAADKRCGIRAAYPPRPDGGLGA